MVRRLGDQERALWGRVIATVEPMHVVKFKVEVSFNARNIDVFPEFFTKFSNSFDRRLKSSFISTHSNFVPHNVAQSFMEIIYGTFSFNSKKFRCLKNNCFFSFFKRLMISRHFSKWI